MSMQHPHTMEDDYGSPVHDPIKAGELPVAQKRCTCGRIFFWCLWVVLFLVLLLGALALIMYFVFQPQSPNFEIIHFQVSNLTVSTSLSSLAAFYLNGVADFTLAGYNPNKVSINYDSINITVYFNDAAFGNSTIPPFSQGPESTSTVNDSLVVDNFPLTLAIGPTFLSLYNTGSIPFRVVSVAQAHINILGIASPSVAVQLSCNVTINMTSSQPTSKVCVSANIPLPSLAPQ